ncbi:MAG: MMPL family transporter [Deltaproteobacteria bacterium]|nr:MMPL family transporter [Deltaproteobacteria bacterium]
MKKQPLVRFSVERPKTVFAVAIIISLAFLTQFPKIKIDTNPKNMLPPDSPVRVWNDTVDAAFGLYTDMMVVGVTNDDGVLNPRTLGKVSRITASALAIKGVAGRDVNAIPTITNVTAEAGGLRVAPLMARNPESAVEIAALKKQLFGNPMFVDRIISADGKTTAVYLPLEKEANGKEIADKLKLITAKEGGPENYYIAGDPVARDTFGAEMFKLMGVFSPIAGFIMFAAIYLMFRSLFLAASMMAVAMISIVWSMGLLVGLGFPVHIMSSMAPVFLMAIATDSIHIFNEFYFRIREGKDKKTAILETMSAVSRPVRYTAMATAAGFGVLLFMSIIPVQVFGGVIAFGTIVLRLLSFSLIPALLTLLNTDKIAKAEGAQGGPNEGDIRGPLATLASIGVNRPVGTVIVSAAAIVISIIGVAKITVNNNMVEWFKKGSDIRTADEVMNKNLGGTSLGYVVAEAGEDGSIKTPAAMRYVEGLQRHLERLPVVGKTSSIADVVKRINYVLHDEGKKYDAIPDNKEEIGQYLFLFGMSAKPSDMDSLVNYPFTKANVWVQLKTWDARAMRAVVAATEEYQKANPLKSGNMTLKPAGNAYFNLVWNDSVLWDMLKGFLAALAVVFIILALANRSMKWAIVGYVPLLFTILLLYGAVGYMGKDFDMPISVLSCLSLGMAVDFAIHFVSRLKQRLAEGNGKGLKDALLWTASRPGKGIMKNAILFAGAFSVMLFAPLTPYITVGAFIVSMMVLSSVFTLVLLPALILTFKGWLFKTKAA